MSTDQIWMAAGFGLTSALLFPVTLSNRFGLRFKPAILLFFVLQANLNGYHALAVSAASMLVGASIARFLLNRSPIRMDLLMASLGALAAFAAFTLLPELDPAQRWLIIPGTLIALTLAQTLISGTLLPGRNISAWRPLADYLLANSLLMIYLASYQAAVLMSGTLGAVVTGIPILVLGGLIDSRQSGLAEYRKKVDHMAWQNWLTSELVGATTTDQYLRRLEDYMSRGKDSSPGRLFLLSRLESGRGWLEWGIDQQIALEEADRPYRPLGFGEISRDGPIAGDGLFLGLDDQGDLLLYAEGSCAELLEDLPEETRENLVHLIGNSWRAMGHSIRSEEAFLAAAVILARLADAKDDYTLGHSQRVAGMSTRLGRELGLSENELRTLQVGALLHDLGKIAIPSEILTKKGLLTRREREIIEKHPEEGASIVGGLSGYDEVVEIIRSHHERLDGNGYPDGLKGCTIPFMARIVAVADTFDAITSTRSYHAHADYATALDTVKVASGQQFDARVVNALDSIMPLEPRGGSDA